jgi:hypothetical protein
MASDRTDAKRAIVEAEQDDPRHDAVIGQAQNLQLDLLREKNRHAEQMRRTELGWFGRTFGGEKSAPSFIALFAMCVGFVLAGFCYYQTSVAVAEQVQFWSSHAERSLAFSGAALGFIFGMGLS